MSDLSKYGIVSAVSAETYVRALITGPTGAGKTYTALLFAMALLNETPVESRRGGVLVIDTEWFTSAKYANLGDFKVMNWRDEYRPSSLTIALHDLSEHFSIIVVDSLSAFWKGPGGTIDMAENEKVRLGNNSFAAWNKPSKEWAAMVNSIASTPAHIIATSREKMEYVYEREGSRSTVKKVGLKPEIRSDDTPYVFDYIFKMDSEHRMVVDKTRQSNIDGSVIDKPGMDWFSNLGNFAESPTVQIAAADAVNMDDVIIHSVDQFLSALKSARPGISREVVRELSSKVLGGDPFPDDPVGLTNLFSEIIGLIDDLKPEPGEVSEELSE